jgi:wobble nucleotide-excising tRNase
LEGLINTANSRITTFTSNIETAKQQIETLRSQTVNTTEAVEKINLVLSNCGFEGFEIVEKDSQNNISRYFLKRPNTTDNQFIFNSLSEGEKNFISFLYFYQLCLGTDDIAANSTKKKIIVIDDPVSSLDSQSLFIVSTLIHSLIERKSNTNPEKKQFKNEQISQVFILTHNIYFYKEVSFERRPMCTDFWHYKISKMNNSTSISGSYNKTVKDDYSLMWNTLKDIKSNMPTDSSLNIMISNVMRRIIESYVNFIGYGTDSWSSLQDGDLSDPSFYIKSAFISTINDESHKVHAMDSTYYQKIIHEQPQILYSVFGSIFKTIGKTHYELQMDEVLN